MLVGIHVDPYGKFSKFLTRYETILDYNGISHVRLDSNQPDFWEKVSKLDLFIFHWRLIDDHHQLAKTIIPIIEKEIGIKCFPNMATCWHYDDKIRQYYLLKQYNFPIIKSWIFWDRQAALQWIEDAKFPLVFKLRSGASSNNVILVKDKRKAKRLINLMFGKGVKSEKIPDFSNIKIKYFNLYKEIHRLAGKIKRKFKNEDISPYWQIHKNYVLFQEFLDNNFFDTRVTIIGNRAFAFRRFNRRHDFRSSGSGKIDYNIEKIDRRCLSIAFKISEKMKFQSMAYDFLYNQNGKPEFSEISYTYQDVAVRNCPGYWDKEFNWHQGHFWPQYFQLVDILNMPNLKQPEIRL